MYNAAIVDNILMLARRLYEGHRLTRMDIEQRCNVSRATAKRYMARLECALPVEADIGDRGARMLRIMKTPNGQGQRGAACGDSAAPDGSA